MNPDKSHFIIILYPEAKHCPVTSDCRELIRKSGTICHRATLCKFFDKEHSPEDAKCFCCYVCIKIHADEGCCDCRELLDTYMPAKSSLKLSKTVSAELKGALRELFEVMGVKKLQVESDLAMSTSSFLKDFVKNVDEIKISEDISRIWHLGSEMASSIFSILEEVLCGEEMVAESDGSTDSNEDESDDDSDSSFDDTSLVIPLAFED